MTLPIHDPVLIFALVMLIVLVAPLVFGKLRIPGIVGLIVAGAIVGPSGAGLLERDSTMVLLGTVGLLYLMFVAGIALDLNQFHKLRSRSLTFGLISFLVPQSLGIAAGLYVLDFSLASSVLLGSIVGSHTLLAYPIASRLGLTKNAAVTTTMGGTIVTDMLALLLLAVVTRFTEGVHGAVFWITFVAVIVLYLTAVVIGLPRIGRWFMRTTHNDPNLSFIFLVTALFVTAYLAQVAGLAPIIGAFIAGIVLNRLVPEIGPLMSRVEFVGAVFFIPFFLISVGMLVDFRSMAEGVDVWIAAGTFTGVVLVGKLLAAKGAQILFGHTSEEGWLIFGLTVPQAAATLAVTLVGFDLGLFDQTVVNAVIIMILLTSLFGPWLVERYGRSVALRQEAAPYRLSDAPQRVLIPLSNPATAHSLVDLALAIRLDGSDEPVYPLTVVQPDGDVPAKVAAGEKLVGEAVVHAVAADVPVTPMTRVDGDPAHGIARAVVEQRISHVVIGWGGPAPPVERIFGSVLDGLLDIIRETVFVARLSSPINTVGRIILAVPPFAERERGFGAVLRDVKMMASRLGTDLHVIVTEQHKKHVLEHVRAAKPDVPLRTEALPRYADLLSWLADAVTEEDLVVLISAKRAQISWQPALDRLPRQYTQELPNRDFVVVYPDHREQDAGGRFEELTHASETAARPSAGYFLEVGHERGEEALREMLRPAIDDEAVIDEIIQLSLLGIDAHRQELGDSLLLLHTHTQHVDRPIRAVGARREGMTFDGLSHKVRGVFLLVNPVDLSPGEHLRALARLAVAAHSVENADYDRMVDTLRDLEHFGGTRGEADGGGVTESYAGVR
ncbi:MAG: cation:proton antiporter [Rhodothermales bacterium]